MGRVKRRGQKVTGPSETESSYILKLKITTRHGSPGQRPEFRARIRLDRPKKDPLDHETPVKFPLNKLQEASIRSSVSVST